MIESDFKKTLATKNNLISMYSNTKIDHQLNADKYYEAFELRKKHGYGALKVSRIIDMPYSAVNYWFLGNAPKSVRGINELESMGLLPLEVSLDKKFEHFVRTFGLRFSDGCIYHQKRNNSYTGYICFGKKEDAKWYVEDSFKFWGIKMGIHHASNAYYVYLPASMVRLMILVGSPVGRKTIQPFIVPNWIFSLPDKLKAAFLDGVFAGDGTVPKLKPSGKSCESLRLSMNSKENVAKDFSKGFMLDIMELLNNLGIESSKPSIKYNQPRISKKKIMTFPVVLNIFTKKRNMIKFLETVPYTYCTKGNRAVKNILRVFENEK